MAWRIIEVIGKITIDGWKREPKDGAGMTYVSPSISLHLPLRIEKKIPLHVAFFSLQVLPYYLKAENNREIERVGRKHHGVGGPLDVERFVDLKYLLLS